MLATVKDPALIADARARATSRIDGPVDVADAWLATVSGVALIEESGRSPDDDQSPRLAGALRSIAMGRLLAVATEDLNGTDDVYSLAASAADLDAFAYARSGLNYALIPVAGIDWVVLCTVNDYLLVAGARRFVVGYAGDPGSVASGFREFIDGDPDWEHPASRKLLRHLDWVES